MNRRAVRATHIAHLAFSRASREHLSLLRGCVPGLFCLLAITACAATQEQRFPLDYRSGTEATFDLDTAREALPAYQRIGAELERRGHYADAAIAYTNATKSARALGRLQDALDASQKAVEMAERAGKPKFLARALLQLGDTHRILNAPHKAIPVFERAVRYAGESSDWQREAAGYTGLSKAYRQLGKPELAAENGTKAAKILEGAILSQIGRRRSRARGQQRLAGLERSYIQALIEVGRDQLTLHQWDIARSTLQKALDAGKRIRIPQLIAEAHRGLGLAAAGQGDFPVAVSNLEEALRLSQRPGFVAATQERLGRVYRGVGRLPEAEVALRQAVASVEDMRSLLQSEELRETFVEDKMEAYAQLVQVLFDQGKLGEAFEVSERARARAFLDLLGNRVSLTKGANAALIGEEKALQERIAQLKAHIPRGDDQEETVEEEAESEEAPLPDQAYPHRELELAREAYTAFLARVRSLNREQASLMTVEPLTLADVQALLPPGAVLLEYFVDGGRTLLWAISRETLQAIPLKIGRVELARRVTELRELIASRGRTEDLQRAARELYITLVAPAFPSGFPRELLIVPHDALHYLPFQALMSAPGRYLIQDAPLYNYSSASLMQFTRAKAQAGAATLFALGNPDLQDPTLNLRFAEREVRAVADLFPDSVFLTRQEATKAKGLEHSPRHSLLHFATHAELDETDPLGSALRLAPSRGDDGRLEVQEVFGLDLHASLVVLSACETALGKLTRGDELTGLTRAFIYAGTPSIITTLWKVSDRASYELMRAFYEHLKAGRDKAAALRQAQLATLAKYPHPYYWAAYQLTGEPR